MSIDVVVLRAGTSPPSIIRRWEETGFFPNLDEWKATALALARQAGAQQNSLAEIFLCLKGHYLVGEYGYESCQLLLKAARQYGWGSKLYIAVDEQVDYRSDQLKHIPQLVVWLDKMHHLRHRATDVVLANFNRLGDLYEYHVADLRRAGDDSASRYGQMSSLIIPAEWHCWVASGKEYGVWLEDTFEEGARNFIIAIALMKSKSKLLENAIGRAEKKINMQPPGGRFAVGVICRNKIPPEVMAFGAKHKIPVLKFRGLLELRYFLMRLNRLCLPKAGQANSLARLVEAVPVENQVFQLGNSARPRLLITSAFNPDDKSGVNCLDAVTDVSEISRCAPAQADCYINPSIRAADVPNILKNLRDLTAWVFHGHSDQYGLKDFDGNLIDVDDWFSNLKGHNVQLPLLILSACQSAEMARKFAQVGVRVAIGFENDVLPEICRLLARRVVVAALDSNGDRKAILLAYNETCRHLQGINIFKPKAFYSV